MPKIFFLTVSPFCPPLLLFCPVLGDMSVLSETDEVVGICSGGGFVDDDNVEEGPGCDDAMADNPDVDGEIRFNDVGIWGGNIVDEVDAICVVGVGTWGAVFRGRICDRSKPLAGLSEALEAAFLATPAATESRSNVWEGRVAAGAAGVVGAGFWREKGCAPGPGKGCCRPRLALI